LPLVVPKLIVMPPEKFGNVSDAFGAVFGKRAGVASGQVLFQEEPDAEAQRQVGRVLSAIQADNYALALDVLGYAPELIGERPLAKRVLDALVERAASSERELHESDAALWFRIVGLGLDKPECLKVAEAAEEVAQGAARDLFNAHVPEEEAFIEAVDKTVYGRFLDEAVERLLKLTSEEMLKQLFWNGRWEELEAKLKEHGLDAESAVGQLSLRDVLAPFCYKGMSSHNAALIMERMHTALEEAIIGHLELDDEAEVTEAVAA